MEQIALKADFREERGRRSSKRLRYQGWIPAVMYGDGDSVPIKVDRKEFTHKIPVSKAESILFEIQVDGESSPAVIREMQLDPITEEILHIDFYKVTRGKKLTISVPIVLVNRDICAGVKAGGVLEEHLREIEIECIPSRIPSSVEVDIANLSIGDAIHVRDIQPPEGVDILQDPDDVIVLVEEPVKGLETTEEVPEEVEEEVAEEKEEEE